MSVIFFSSIAMELNVPCVEISTLISTKNTTFMFKTMGRKKKDPCGTRTQDTPFGSPTDYSLSYNSDGYNLEIWIYFTHALIYLIGL